MNITSSDGAQNVKLENHEVRILTLERSERKTQIAVDGLVKATTEQSKSIKILEKVMYGVLSLALAVLVKLVVGIG